MEKKKWLIYLLVVIVMILFVTGGVIFGMNYRIWTQDTLEENGSQAVADPGNKLQVDPGAGEYVEPDINESPAEGIAIPGWGYITIPAGEIDVAVDLPNPEANTDKYYLTFELRLKETGEILYTSELVPPGQTIQNITLSRALEEGKYQAVMHVQPYTMDEKQTPTNNADMETELVVYK